MKELLTARVVAHYLGGDDALPRRTRITLEAFGIRVMPAPDRETLRKLAAAVPADVLLVSSAMVSSAALTLPALRSLYGRRGLAVIVLALAGVPPETVAEVLASGADDVLVAPAEPAVLAARVDAAVRTVEQLAAPASAARGVLRTRDGEIALDAKAARCLVRDGDGYREVLLSRKQLAALAALLRAAGRPVRWSDLFRRGWRPGKLRDRSRTLVQHVLALRRKLGSAGRRIVAVPGVGYRLAD